jgi:cytochrome c-type biogenesis protein CcmH
VAPDRARGGRLRLRRRTSWIPWLALAAVVVIAIAVVIARSGPSHTASARATRLYNELACPVCTGESVADSNAPESRAIRIDVVRRIRAGQTDGEIRDAYVAEYDEHILLTPSNGGLGVIAWGVPVVALVIGAAGILLALRRWSHTPRLAVTGDDEALVDRERDRALEGLDPDGETR